MISRLSDLLLVASRNAQTSHVAVSWNLGTSVPGAGSDCLPRGSCMLVEQMAHLAAVIAFGGEVASELLALIEDVQATLQQATPKWLKHVVPGGNGGDGEVRIKRSKALLERLAADGDKGPFHRCSD